MTAAIPLGRCRITDARLSHLLSIAFRLRSMEYLKGGPDWVMGGDDRYNIEAKADDPSKATEAQLLEMLQTLLIERFRLKFHIDSVDKPGFALVVAKNGPKVKESKSEESSMNMPGGKPRPGEPVSFVGRKISMANLVNLLTQVGSGPVIDKTGLEGFYDFKLTWDESAGPTLFTALQEQLGLRCEPQKVPVSVFVIESAQKPAGN
jgi:uncharacterized protein (TIGR03435 family)